MSLRQLAAAAAAAAVERRGVELASVAVSVSSFPPSAQLAPASSSFPGDAIGRTTGSS